MQCAELQYVLSSGGWAGCSFACFASMSHGGDKPVSDTAPRIAWQCYTTSALLDTLGEITAVLKEREKKDEVVSPSVWDPPEVETATDSQGPELTAQGLKKPWTCGYCCRWCSEPCGRKEGHTFHSCYEHRHRR